MTVLSSEAFDAALRQWLVQGPGPPTPTAAVITCAWLQGQASQGERTARELAVWLSLSCLQAWAQRVPGSFSGQTQAGTGLLLVPVYSEAQETVLALQSFLDSAVRSLGVPPSAGGWVLRVIGPLTPGTGPEVRRQLARAGWPVS